MVVLKKIVNKLGQIGIPKMYAGQTMYVFSDDEYTHLDTFVREIFMKMKVDELSRKELDDKWKQLESQINVRLTYLEKLVSISLPQSSSQKPSQ
jgi:RNAse (barnase) inhibitor barstar